jgi:hypothetical protein
MKAIGKAARDGLNRGTQSFTSAIRKQLQLKSNQALTTTYSQMKGDGSKDEIYDKTYPALYRPFYSSESPLSVPASEASF